MNTKRTHNCGELRSSDVGKTVSLAGWVHKRRDLGSVVFLDLRDLYGKAQLVIDPKKHPELSEALSSIRLEWVISITGTVKKRKDPNPKLSTGEIEISVTDLQVLSSSKTPPFSVFQEEDVQEDLRLRYRFLDIRKGAIAQNLILRHQVMLAVRSTLSSIGFFEINTPILGKTTPEGARDYLVPSRVHPKSFYALPQSPQLFKQLLMMSGMDRYFQIAPCFRDEDLRKDRQPEFTQIDIEMSFTRLEDFFPIIEELMQKVFALTGKTLSAPFPRLSYAKALDLYGTDKPDLRFAMPFIELSSILQTVPASFIQDLFSKGSISKALLVKGGAKKSRKEIDAFIQIVQNFGLSTLTWIKRKDGDFSSNALKILSKEILTEIATKAEMQEDDLLLIGIGEKLRLYQAMDHLRRHIGDIEGLIDPNKHAVLWVTDFPLFTKDPDTNRIESAHHPFTAPHPEDLSFLRSNPENVRSLAYDLVIDGYEMGSGSMRIHDSALQQEIFAILELDEEQMHEKFGFFLNALQYGTPPHLGIALGLDRLMMILCNAKSIRDVIAFPKTLHAKDLMMQAPSRANPEHLQELCLKHISP